LKGTTLHDLENMDDGSYDQFANKNTTYSENLYTSQAPDINKLSKQQIATAEKVSREIAMKDS